MSISANKLQKLLNNHISKSDWAAKGRDPSGWMPIEGFIQKYEQAKAKRLAADMKKAAKHDH